MEVQGVGYRFFATRVARRSGQRLDRDSRDGYVEAIVERRKRRHRRMDRRVKKPAFRGSHEHRSGVEGFHRRLGDFDVKF